ncbi:MAG: nucleotide sugar dehydrogenase [Candidatus Omnitrophica bacterium]|nr:nucleotide sugar dehydrogenase [Candidatus Omnitrophota bacterium]
MGNAEKLRQLINSKKSRITVIGLGYVGLPIALAFIKKGFFVYGLDNNTRRIDNLKKGVSYITDIPDKDISVSLKTGRFIPTSKEDILKFSDVVIICVPTPLRKTKLPDVSYIVDATRHVAGYLHPGQLVILESTTYPGTTRDVMQPILERKKLKEGRDFFLAFSPERIDPGNKKYTLENIPKVVGGVSEVSGTLTGLLYSKIIRQIHKVSTVEAAEVVKLLENTFRIVNLGLINEFAILCDKLKINVWEVVEAAKTKPFGFMPFYPGPGIGGHCIPVDPLYLSWKAKKIGFKTRMIDLASRINLFRPYYTAQKAQKVLRAECINISRAKVLILGVTYKKDVKDLRESPALEIINILQEKKAIVDYYDPYIPYLKINSINLKSIKLNAANLKKYNLVILVTDHSGFNYKFISEHASMVLDTRNAFGSRRIRQSSIISL